MKKWPSQIGVGGFILGKTEKKFIQYILSTSRVSYGKYSKKFENQFAKLHNQKFAVFMNSGTSALHVALQAIKEKYGWNDEDEIIVPALTFVATVNIVIHNRMKPVFVDVDPLHFDIDPVKIEEKITSKTRAIIPVNIMGQSAPIDKIISIAKKYNLKIIEDSCET